MSDKLTNLRNKLELYTSPFSAHEAKISPNELKSLKETASAGGNIRLADINTLTAEVEQMDKSQARNAQLAALADLRNVANRAAGSKSRAIHTAIAVLETVNPSAYVKWAMGGDKPGRGLW